MLKGCKKVLLNNTLEEPTYLSLLVKEKKKEKCTITYP